MAGIDERDGGHEGVLALQMEALYKSAPASVLSIVGALMALVVYWSPGLRTGLIVWFICVSAVALVHLASAVLRRAGKPASWTPVTWSRFVLAIYLGSGLSWGVGGAWMLGHGDEQQALVICCLAMGAVTVTFPAAVFPRAFDVFQVPILGAFAVGLAVSDLEHAVVLSIASAMLAAAMAIIGHEIGGQLVLAIRLSQENARLARRLEERGAALEAANAELEIQSLTDPLTGAANRRRLMSFLRSAPRRCAILVVDVDHFKSYNDSFGHADGDVCLVLVAGALRDCIRPQVDLVARQGGEEFAVVLTDVCDEEAMSIAERIRVAVEALSTAQPRQIRRLVTVSIGVAWRSPKQRKTLDSLMAEADAALYEAKRSGRNRVCAGLSGNRAVA